METNALDREDSSKDFLGINELVYSNDYKGVIDLFGLLENSEH